MTMRVCLGLGTHHLPAPDSLALLPWSPPRGRVASWGSVRWAPRAGFTFCCVSHSKRHYKTV